uniref:Protein FAR1-RELATED SEQUENCE n=1 Tax=Setaria italica TaxID=4555 RepID=K4AKH9_SETIT
MALSGNRGGVGVLATATYTFGVDVEDGVEVLSTPQESFIDMTFNSSDSARDYYNSYARHTRFSIRTDTSQIAGKEREFINLLHGCNITTTRASQIMGELYGSIAHCPYTEGDAKNLRVEYCAENKVKDMKATLDYFEELKNEDPDFYYNYTPDDEDRLENLSWVDGAARKAYKL